MMGKKERERERLIFSMLHVFTPTFDEDDEVKAQTLSLFREICLVL